MNDKWRREIIPMQNEFAQVAQDLSKWNQLLQVTVVNCSFLVYNFCSGQRTNFPSCAYLLTADYCESRLPSAYTTEVNGRQTPSKYSLDCCDKFSIKRQLRIISVWLPAYRESCCAQMLLKGQRTSGKGTLHWWRHSPRFPQIRSH